VARILLALLLLSTLACAGAQQRHNYLAVNGAIVDAAGPFYFIAHGDSANAFARAAPLAEAMGLKVEYLPEERVLRFTDGFRTARFRATSDIAAGLVKAPGVISVNPPVNGEPTPASPTAILVDAVSSVPIAPLALAFEGESGWVGDRRLVTVDTASRFGYAIARPRTGITDGVSRVAVDIPAGASYQVAADGSMLLLAFPGARAEDVNLVVDDANLTSLTLGNANDSVSLVVRTRHQLDPQGRGFRVGEVDKGDVRTVYVDLAPSLVGAAVTALTTGANSAATPAPIEVPVALTTVPEQRQVVVIDAGHGGHDPGASSRYATEKWVVLSVALKLKDLLEREGVQVILTRGDDTFLTLQQRSLFSSSDRNVFVSIHANAAHSSSAHGIETFVFGEPLEPGMIERAIRENGGGAEGEALTAEARRVAADLAGDILREAQLNYSRSLAQSVQHHLVSATGATDRGVRTNLFYVIRNARIPAILVELGFVSNPDEGRKLATEAYQQTLAQALADGVLEFLRNGGLTAHR
jgi:N-acetylmuramoyl-L-alanine amidase